MGDFTRFSQKQMTALTWWRPGSPHEARDAVICDGAVRSGKTFCLSLGFLLWSMTGFDGQCFALCGKTVAALRRNVVSPLLPCLRELGFAVKERLSRGVLEVAFQNRRNRFYLFGGRDEGSAALIQGVTLAGVLLRRGRAAVVLLQSRASAALVLHRVDPQGEGKKRPLSALHHARQPLPLPRRPAAV